MSITDPNLDDPDITNVAAEVKDILETMRRGQGDSFEMERLREQLAEAQQLADARARAQADLERSLKVRKPIKFYFIDHHMVPTH